MLEMRHEDRGSIRAPRVPAGAPAGRIPALARKLALPFFYSQDEASTGDQSPANHALTNIMNLDTGRPARAWKWGTRTGRPGSRIRLRRRELFFISLRRWLLLLLSLAALTGGLLPR